MRLVYIWWCNLERRCRILGSQGIPRRTGKAPPCGIWVRQDRRAPALRVGLGCCRGCALARATSVFALVERALQPASNTRVTGLTAAIVSLGLPKLQEKSSKWVPFSTKSSPRVTYVTPGQRGYVGRRTRQLVKIPKHLFLCSERMFGDTDRAWRSP